MRKLKKFDISNCKDPATVEFKQKPLTITPLEQIEHPWQRERARKAQEIHSELLERLKKDVTWKERFEEHQRVIREKIKKQSN